MAKKPSELPPDSLPQRAVEASLPAQVEANRFADAIVSLLFKNLTSGEGDSEKDVATIMLIQATRDCFHLKARMEWLAAVSAELGIASYGDLQKGKVTRRGTI